MSWLNKSASLNIQLILVTFEVSQLEMSWLNDLALENISFILVTFEVSHLEMSWLNVSAPSNKYSIFVILEVSKFVTSSPAPILIFSLSFIKSGCEGRFFSSIEFASSNIPLVSVTFDTSHLEISWLNDSAPINI